MTGKQKLKSHYYDDGMVLIKATCETEAREKARELRAIYERAVYPADAFLIDDADRLMTLYEREKEWGNFVYVMKCAAGPVKIGVAKSIIDRRNMLQTGNPYAVAISAAFMCSQSDRVERAAHKILASRRMCGEWFDAEVIKAVVAVQQAARESGCLVLPASEPFTALALQVGRQRDALGVAGS